MDQKDLLQALQLSVGKTFEEIKLAEQYLQQVLAVFNNALYFI